MLFSLTPPRVHTSRAKPQEDGEGGENGITGRLQHQFQEDFTQHRLVFLYMLLLLSFGFYKLEWKTAFVKTRY